MRSALSLDVHAEHNGARALPLANGGMDRALRSDNHGGANTETHHASSSFDPPIRGRTGY